MAGFRRDGHIYIYIYMYIYIYIYIYVLLKALPPVCMKYTARDESGVANISRGEAECYAIFFTRLSSRAVCFLQMKRQCFKCFIVFYTYQSVNKTQIFGHFDTFIE